MHIKGQHKTLATVSCVEFADFINQSDEFREAAFSLSRYKMLDLQPKCPQAAGRSWGQTREVMGFSKKQRQERMLPCHHSPPGLGNTFTSRTAAWAPSNFRTVPRPLDWAVLRFTSCLRKSPHLVAPWQTSRLHSHFESKCQR